MKIQTYREFWPYYLTQHQHPWTRRLHGFGTLLGLAIAGIFLWQGQPWMAFWGLVPAYAIAWLSHGFIEKNRPATWTYPVWSFVSDFRLCWRLLTRQSLP